MDDDCVDEIAEEIEEYLDQVARGPKLEKQRQKILKYRIPIYKGFSLLAESFTPNNPIAIEKKFFRAVKARFVRSKLSSENLPFSTEGSRLHPGRYHLADNPLALYFGENAHVIIDECRIDEIDSDDHYELFQVQIKLPNVIDLSTKVKCERQDVIPDFLGFEWMYFNDQWDIPAYTQLLGRKIKMQDYEGILVKSHRRKTANNLIVFPENLKSGSIIKLTDNSDKLKEMGFLKKNQFIKG